MNILCHTLDHSRTPGYLQERLQLSEDDLRVLLRQLRDDPTIHEVLWVRHVGGTDIFLLAHEREKATRRLCELLGGVHPPGETLEASFRIIADEGAVRHLFSRAVGFAEDAQENLSGFGTALRAGRDTAVNAGACGEFLSNLVDQALQVARRVQEKTRYRPEDFSPVAVVSDLVSKVFHNLHRKNVLVIGENRLLKPLLRILAEKGPRTIRYEDVKGALAGELEQSFDARTGSVSEHGAESDVLVLSNCGDEAEEALQRLLHRNYSRTRLLFDLRTGDARPLTLGPDVFAFDIAAIDLLLREKRRRWRNDLERVEALIEEESSTYLSWLNTQRVGYFISVLRRRAATIREKHLEKYGRKMSESERSEVAALVDDLLDTVVDEITGNVRSLESSSQVNLREYELLCRLFDVTAEEIRRLPGSDDAG